VLAPPGVSFWGYSVISNVLRSSVLVVAGAVLSGCIYSGGAEAVQHMDPVVARGAHIDTINVTVANGIQGQELATIMPEVLRQELNTCATGSQPLHLEVNVTGFKGQNAAMTILLGDGAKLQGTAKLIEPKTNQVVGDYDVSESVGGGGILAAAGMADAERSLSQEFAESLCKQAFRS